MHGACVFENKEQYDKANKILTVVLQNALEKDHLTREQYDAINAFQLKVAEKERYIAYHVRKHIPLTFDAMTTSPVESINCHIKHISKANGKNNASRSLQLITQDTDLRISDVLKRNQRELQLNVIGSKLPDTHLFSRKCVFMLNDQFDSRKLHKCAMVALDSWIVWNFDLVSLCIMQRCECYILYDTNILQTTSHLRIILNPYHTCKKPPSPKFQQDIHKLGELFPRFLNVYTVSVTSKGNQNFLQCDCQLYTRCGIPCCHVFKVTDAVTKEMISIQHWKVFPVHYGAENSPLSMSLMRKVAWQKDHETFGMPISASTYKQCYRVINRLGNERSPAVYPLLYNDITEYEYRRAIYVLTTKNTVNLKELDQEFSLVGGYLSIE